MNECQLAPNYFAYGKTVRMYCIQRTTAAATVHLAHIESSSRFNYFVKLIKLSQWTLLTAKYAIEKEEEEEEAGK